MNELTEHVSEASRTLENTPLRVVAGVLGDRAECAELQGSPLRTLLRERSSYVQRRSVSLA